MFLSGIHMHDPSAGIKVSVSIITYNHEEYIAQAIDSVLAQEHDYPIEIIIGDDHSSDRTPVILKEYQKKYPDLIQLILHPRDYDDIPGRINNTTNLLNCRGEYIAMLDGDDYWKSTDKLKRQIEFLDVHPEFSLAVHDCTYLYNNSGATKRYSTKFNYPKQSQVIPERKCVSDNFFGTSTYCYRNLDLEDFENWFHQIYAADYALQLMLLKRGKVWYFEDLFSVRRITGKGHSALARHTAEGLKLRISDERIFSEQFPAYGRDPNFEGRLTGRYYKLSRFNLDGQNYVGFIKYYSVYRLRRLLGKTLQK